MQIKHTGQLYRTQHVTDSYQKVVDNIDNFASLTGIMASLSRESFGDAITYASTYSNTIVVEKAVTISDDTTVPSNVHLIIRPGGSFSIDSGKTLTISGTVDSCGQSRSTIFTGSGTAAYTTSSELVGPISIEMDMTENTKIIELGGAFTDLTKASRQGCLNIDASRSSSYAMTTTDGNPDTGLKVTVKQRSASAGYARTRALDITADLRDSGSASQFVEGMQMTAKSRSGTTVVDMTVSRFIIDNGATASGNIVGVQVQDNSQSATGTMYGILLNSSNYNITREFGIFIDSDNGSWTNAISFNGTITNVFDFEDTDGTNGATIGTYSSNKSANPSGDILVDVGGTAKYLYLYANKPTYA